MFPLLAEDIATFPVMETCPGPPAVFMKGLPMSSLLFAMVGSPIQLVIIALIAFLLFGNRLPSVMRSLGRSVTEFKKGVAGIEEEIDAAAKSSSKNAASDNSDKSEE